MSSSWLHECAYSTANTFSLQALQMGCALKFLPGGGARTKVTGSPKSTVCSLLEHGDAQQMLYQNK